MGSVITVYSDFEKIQTSLPKFILEAPKWVCFMISERNGKKIKPPVSPVPGQKIGTNNPASWASFDVAAEYCQRHGCAGVGIMMNDDGICAIDIDDCIDASGTMSSYAERIINHFDGYAERSISGTGVHLICRCDPGLKINCNLRNLPHGNKIEIASFNKYLTVSGNCIVPLKDDTENCTEDLLKLYQHQVSLNGKHNMDDRNKTIAKRKIVNICNSDSLVLNMLRKSKDRKTNDLYDGITMLNQSQADFRLCLGLMYWCHCDTDQVDRLFRGSALMREKWDRPYSDGSTYGSRTIEAARRNYVQYS